MLKKVYIFSYFILNGFSRNMYDDGFAVQKAISLIVLIQFLWLTALLTIWGFKLGPSYSSIYVLVMGVILYKTNSYILLKRTDLQPFLKQYAKLTIPVKLIWCFVLLALCVGGWLLILYVAS
ncbi:hypothetical protein [Pontibacter fetidus]|uniref:Uncharacterized protein n=1 Tax=Pontibacter fetidus TaxID=2700082 RepID=A0A6B2HBA2_9BACT|nr:hypothetical protein [Pontibacter fetidus]NDK56854.1 hypothetical protein [Pontibacter fetidus]